MYTVINNGLLQIYYNNMTILLQMPDFGCITKCDEMCLKYYFNLITTAMQ